MIRSLTSGTLSGWQESKEQTTDLTQLAASFRIEKGQATSSDLNLVGPLVRMTGAGTIDLAAKSLAFRVEPKLVMTTEGQGRAADPVGLGIPVVIDGPWSEPRIYPDMAGILDHPDAAYAKLKEMGQGLFGSTGALNGLGGMGGQRRRQRQQWRLRSAGRPARRDPGQFDPAEPRPKPQSASRPSPAQAGCIRGAGAERSGAAASQDSEPMKDVLKQLFNR